MLTLDFLPEAGGEIEGISIVGNGKLPCVSSGAPEEADLILCVEGDAMSNPGEGSVPENLELLKGHSKYNLTLFKNHHKRYR